MNRLGKMHTFFGRTAAPGKMMLDQVTIDSFFSAADARPSGNVPTIYDLAELCNALKRTHPSQSRAALRKLRWLIKMSARIHGSEWDSPWQTTR